MAESFKAAGIRNLKLAIGHLQDALRMSEANRQFGTIQEALSKSKGEIARAEDYLTRVSKGQISRYRLGVKHGEELLSSRTNTQDQGVPERQQES